jgi:hypothetical protein
VRPHLPEEELHAWLDGELSSAQRADVAQHLLACLICRALEAEVRAVREHASRLLAIATPASIRRPAIPAARRQLRWGRVTGLAAAATAVVGTSWLLGLGGGSQAPAILLATAAPVTQAIHASYPAPAVVEVRLDPPPAPVPSRRLVLASRAAMTPQIAQPTGIIQIADRRLRVVDPMAGLSPAVGEGWQTTSFQEAREASNGELAHLEGLETRAVRLQPSTVGGRATAMVRQLLPDGRVVWVVEGALEELEQVYRVLDASGLNFSTTQRGRPDYIGPDDAPIRTTRMVTVASYLPVDSLNHLLETRLRY